MSSLTDAVDTGGMNLALFVSGRRAVGLDIADTIHLHWLIHADTFA